MSGLTNDIVRRRINITSYSAPRLRAFRTAMKKFMAINDNRGYTQLAGYHGVPDWFCWHGISRSDRFRPTTFRGHVFLPWHRIYLKRFEDFLLDQDDGLSLPWWDATSILSHSEGIPKAYTDATADGEPNPLNSFNIPERIDMSEAAFLGRDTFRRPGSPGALPTSAEVEALWEISDFGEFSTAVQDIHDYIHGWTGGHMRTQAYSAYDPIFWAHHCNIDRLWAIWQTRHGNNLPVNLPEVELEPFGAQVKDVLKIYDLGYEYASAISEVKF